MFKISQTDKIGVIGLGYVGLPLAVEFGKISPTVGFDIQPSRIEELKLGTDRTLEVTATELAQATELTYTTNPDELANCRVFIAVSYTHLTLPTIYSV